MNTQLLGIYKSVKINGQTVKFAHVYFTENESPYLSNYVIEGRKGERIMVTVAELTELKLTGELTTFQYLNWQH